MDLIRYMPDATVSSIAQILGVAKSSVSQRISEMESKGLVVRHKDEHDARISHVGVAPDAIDDVSAVDASIREAAQSLGEECHRACGSLGTGGHLHRQSSEQALRARLD